MSMRLRSLWLRLPLAIAALLWLNASECFFGGRQLFTGFGSSTPQTTVAPITGFGSVWVGGTEFTTTSGTLTVDDAAATELALRPGQVAAATGTLASGSTSGTSSTFAVSDQLIGPVSATDPATGTFTVLGATVQVTGDTSVGLGIVPADVAGLTVGQAVAVNGYRTSTGMIAARLDPVVAGQVPRVAGPVSNLDGFALSFTIGATTIDYSQVSGGLPATVRDGSYVVASGGTVTNATTLRAAQVTVEAETPGGASGASALVHGAITRFGSSTDFDVGGQTVSTSASTTFNGGTATDLLADREVEVSGQFDGSGTVAAAVVNIVPAASFRVVGPVAALNATGSTLVIAGITLSTDDRTVWDDLSAPALHVFAFPSLSTGDWVEVRGIAGSGTNATAHVLERRTQPSPAFVELQAVPSSLANPALTLVGVSVDTSSARFYDATGQALTRTSFFAQAGGQVVRVVGSFIGATLTAETVALRP